MSPGIYIPDYVNIYDIINKLQTIIIKGIHCEAWKSRRNMKKIDIRSVI